MTQRKTPPRKTVCRARSMRRDATFPESLLWTRLRDGRLAGLKFRRQHVLGPFVADFYCHAAQLVVEIDGQSHDGRAQYDQSRTAYLEQLGLRVLRIGNDDVLEDLDSVLAGLLIACGIKPD